MAGILEAKTENLLKLAADREKVLLKFKELQQEMYLVDSIFSVAYNDYEEYQIEYETIIDAKIQLMMSKDINSSMFVIYDPDTTFVNEVFLTALDQKRAIQQGIMTGKLPDNYRKLVKDLPMKVTIKDLDSTMLRNAFMKKELDEKSYNFLTTFEKVHIVYIANKVNHQH